jgi:hypothetical protein
MISPSEVLEQIRKLQEKVLEMEQKEGWSYQKLNIPELKPPEEPVVRVSPALENVKVRSFVSPDKEGGVEKVVEVVASTKTLTEIMGAEAKLVAREMAKAMFTEMMTDLRKEIEPQMRAAVLANINYDAIANLVLARAANRIADSMERHGRYDQKN